MLKTTIEPETHSIDSARSVSVEHSSTAVRSLAPSQLAPPVHPLHSMQRSLGNRATRRILTASILQPKLTVGAPDDAYEKEADAVAERVMARTSLTAAGSSGADDDDNHHRGLAKNAAQREPLQRDILRRIPISTLQQTMGNRALARLLQDRLHQETRLTPAVPTLSRKCSCGGDAKEECEECSKSHGVQRTSTGEGALTEAPPIVEEVLATAGQPLAAFARQTLEPGFGHDFSGVRVHDDAKAAESASAVSALAYTVGNHIVFGAGRYSPGTNDGNRLLAHELTHTIQQGSVIRRDDDNKGNGGDTSGKQVIDALTQKDPIAGVGDTTKAFAILKGLTTDQLIGALIEVDNAALIDVLVSALAPDDQSEVASAICAVRFTTSHGQPDDQFGIRAAKGIAQLAESDQDQLISMVLQRRGSTASVKEVREGAAALMESEATRQAGPEVDADAPAAMLAGIAMGPWNPGGMPIPYYIGNAAHVAIAAAYAAQHSTDAAFYNFTPVSSILQAAAALGIKINPAAATAAQLGLKPDIANLTRTQLYEIKPVTLQMVGSAEVLLYLAAFLAAGVPMLPGPVGEPGTSGTLPAPGGWFVYSAPEPGVITYAYRQPPRRKPANDNATEPVTAPDKSLVQRISIATGLTGTALTIYLIISEGSRLFPPRNLVPVP